MAINSPIKVPKAPEEPPVVTAEVTETVVTASQEEPPVNPPEESKTEPPIVPEPSEDYQVIIRDKSPCNWKIEGDENGIEAKNYLTGETFIGNPRTFYKALRG